MNAKVNGLCIESYLYIETVLVVRRAYFIGDFLMEQNFCNACYLRCCACFLPKLLYLLNNWGDEQEIIEHFPE